MKHEISLYRPLNMAAPEAFVGLRAVLDAIVQKRAPYERTMLTISFEGLGPPLSGRVSAPVHIKAHHHEARYQSEISITGAAPALFPVFNGTISVNGLRDQGSELWLEGDYTPPMGGPGEIIDRTLLNSAAQRSLAQMLEWLTIEISRYPKAS